MTMRAGLAPLIAAGVALMLSAAPVVACPSAKDLDRGIAITTGKANAQVTKMVKHIGNDLYWQSQQSSLFPDRWTNLRHAGVWGLYWQRQSGSGKKIQTYAKPLEDMTPLQNGQTHEFRSTWGDPDGSKTWVADLTVTVEAVDPVEVKGCRYDRLMITTRGPLTLPTGTTKQYHSTSYFLPELRFHGTGYYDILDIRKLRFWQRAISVSELEKMAMDEPALQQILTNYGVAR